MSDEVIFTAAELLQVTTQVQRHFVNDNPDVCLPGTNEALTESQFRALCWVRGVADLLYRKGLCSSVQPRLDIPDTEPDTEGL